MSLDSSVVDAYIPVSRLNACSIIYLGVNAATFTILCHVFSKEGFDDH